MYAANWRDIFLFAAQARKVSAPARPFGLYIYIYMYILEFWGCASRGLDSSASLFVQYMNMIKFWKSNCH